MLASSLTGVIWYQFGARVAFETTAFATVLVIVYFAIGSKRLIVKVK